MPQTWQTCLREEDNLAAAQATALAQNPKIKEAEITVRQADNVGAWRIGIHARSRRVLPLPLALRRELRAHKHHGGRVSSSTGSPSNGDAASTNVNERAIEVEQSKLGLDDTRNQILINVDNQFRALHEARVAVAVASAKREASEEKLHEVTQTISAEDCAAA